MALLKILEDDNIKTGIGGFIKDSNEKFVYIFSGPSCGNDIFQVELEASQSL